MSTACRKNNLDTNIPTVLDFSFGHFKCFLLKLSVKTNINLKKLPIILRTRGKYQFHIWRFVAGNWVRSVFVLIYFICAINEETYHLKMLKNSHYFVIVQIILFIYQGEHLEVLLIKCIINNNFKWYQFIKWKGKNITYTWWNRSSDCKIKMTSV